MNYRIVISPSQHQDGKINLTPSQYHYLYRVLRLSPGDQVIALDGTGKTWLTELEGESALVKALISEMNELPLEVTLIVALPKGNGFDEIVRCCTELGVTTLIPTLSDRTLLHPSPHKLERWRKIATEAAEQSERQRVPTLTPPLTFNQVLENLPCPEADCYLGVTRESADHLLTCLQTRHSDQIAIATGPEGGWTVPEIEGAIARGFQPVSLGSRILRAITAPIAALSLVAAVSETQPLFIPENHA